MSPPLASLTRQNYDLQFGVNVLGHFYLTQLLHPVLLATAKATGQKTRVLSYTCATAPVARIDYTTLMNGPARRRCSMAHLHKQSKLVSCASRTYLGRGEGELTYIVQGNLLFALELAEQYGEQEIMSLLSVPQCSKL